MLTITKRELNNMYRNIKRGYTDMVTDVAKKNLSGNREKFDDIDEMIVYLKILGDFELSDFNENDVSNLLSVSDIYAIHNRAMYLLNRNNVKKTYVK